MIALAAIQVFDPGHRFVAEHQAGDFALLVSHLSPLEMAFRFSRMFILGSPLDLGYLICIPIWLFIGFHGVRYGSKVYMDVFFRRA